MTAPQMHARRPRWRWIALFWCAGALFEAGQSIFMLHTEGRHRGELRLFATEFATWLPWALATFLVVGLARRYPLVPVRSLRALAIHAAALVGISLIAEAWSAMLQVLFDPWQHSKPPLFWPTLSTNLIYQALNCVAAYALIITITYLVDSREKVARQAIEAAGLATQLSESQLAALRRQIEPHFMFNTLNSIAGLVRDRRNDAAVDMIVGLSEFLRRATEDSHRPLVPLAEEVEYLQRYVEIEKVRFSDRLQISIDVPADLLRVQVPSLLLQPLVENAIKHGVAKRVAGGAIHVKAERQEGHLLLSVSNDGPKLPREWDRNGAGVGLANLRTRLRILHGDTADLQLRQVADSGVEVVVRLPLVEV